MRDCVEVALEKEVDTIRTQQGKMRDFLLQVTIIGHGIINIIIITIIRV